jgi:uncharacterized phage protein (TIGR02216 family)
MMAFAFGVLRLPPSHFWAMTPRELGCAVEAVLGPAGPSLERTSLQQLMNRFPDGR